MSLRYRIFSSIILILFFSPLAGLAQPDTIWVQGQAKEAYIRHIVGHGETLFMLAARFHAPAAAVAGLNDMNYQEGLPEGSIFKIPLGKYNYLRINSVVESRPIYYKVQEGQRLKSVSRLFHIAQGTIQRWNKLPMPEVFAGQVLQVGWVQFDSTQVPFAISPEAEHKIVVKAVRAPSIANDTDNDNNGPGESGSSLALGAQFHEAKQGKDLQETSGATVFFTIKSKLAKGVYYAFFDAAPRGSIISIYNPSGQKYIYAKVIGPLPKISKYHNAVLGLSANAAKDLNAKTPRIFCKIKY
ncbi:MAG TPA: LysM peptidoglycan-binding domain-containing protein [Edaphocola sp.]|nr:LysM peptidoglycan-binding domain-containing protein [Edaphocola sp.]